MQHLQLVIEDAINKKIILTSVTKFVDFNENIHRVIDTCIENICRDHNKEIIYVVCLCELINCRAEFIDCPSDCRTNISDFTIREILRRCFVVAKTYNHITLGAHYLYLLQ
jgi:hypothetical protein